MGYHFVQMAKIAIDKIERTFVASFVTFGNLNSTFFSFFFSWLIVRAVRMYQIDFNGLYHFFTMLTFLVALKKHCMKKKTICNF